MEVCVLLAAAIVRMRTSVAPQRKKTMLHLGAVDVAKRPRGTTLLLCEGFSIGPENLSNDSETPTKTAFGLVRGLWTIREHSGFLLDFF